MGRIIIIITGGHNTPDGEDGDEEQDQNYRVDDLQVGEQALGARVGNPGQRGRGWASGGAEGGFHSRVSEGRSGTPETRGSDCTTEGRKVGGKKLRKKRGGGRHHCGRRLAREESQ